MAPEALPPNPVPSRAVSNDISLLLSSKATRLRNTALFRNNLASSSASTAPKPSPHAVEDSVFTPGGQNSGIGYVASSTDKNKAGDAATATLRNKLLGKRKGRGGESGRKGGVDSEEDDDEGRSGLGKRKKVKKSRREEEDESVADGLGEEEAHVAQTSLESTKFEEEVPQSTKVGSPGHITDGQQASAKHEKKKKKSKNKNKNNKKSRQD